MQENAVIVHISESLRVEQEKISMRTGLDGRTTDENTVKSHMLISLVKLSSVGLYFSFAVCGSK